MKINLQKSISLIIFSNNMKVLSLLVEYSISQYKLHVVIFDENNSPIMNCYFNSILIFIKIFVIIHTLFNIIIHQNL